MFRKLLDRNRKPKNDIKDFVDHVGKNKYLQTRQSKARGIDTYLREIADDIHYGVIREINFIEEVYGDEWHTPVDKNPKHTILQVKGKKRVLLLYYEFIEKEGTA